jgi:OmpA-OmpF porin, OOP family
MTIRKCSNPECQYETNDNRDTCFFCSSNLVTMVNNQPKKSTQLRKSDLLISGLAAVIGLGIAVALTIRTTTATSSKDTLTVLGDTFSGYSTFRSKDFLEATGLTYQNEFDQLARATALGNTADIIVTSLDQVMEHRPDGKIVGLIDHTKGADAVLWNSKVFPLIKDMDDLDREAKLAQRQGKQYSIVYASDTPSEYLLRLLVLKFPQLSLEYFQHIQVADASEAYDVLTDPSKNVALAVLWEPFVTKAKAEGYKVALTSADVPEAIIDVIVASNRLIKNDPKRLQQIISRYYARVDAWKLNATALKQQIRGDDASLTDGAALRIMEGVHFFDAGGTMNWFQSGRMQERIDATWRTVAQYAEIPELTGEELYSSVFVEPAFKRWQKIEASRPQAQRPQQQAKAPQQLTTVGKLSEDINFELSSVAIAPPEQQKLKQVLERAKAFDGGTQLELIGHSSKGGSDNRNRQLSQFRVQAVESWLKRNGYSKSAIVKFAGSDQPLEGVDPSDTRNQRVEVRLVRGNAN